MATAQAGNGNQQVRRPRKQANSVTIQGNLAVKPELRHAGSGPEATPVTTLAVYNSEIVQGVQQTNRINVVLFGKMAEDAVQHLNQGREVIVTGRLRQRSYEDRTSPAAKALGQPITRSTVEIIARECIWGFDPAFARQQATSAQGDASVEPADAPTAQQAQAEPAQPAMVPADPPGEQPAAEGVPVAAAAAPDGAPGGTEEDIPF
jgi:single stranded DNA-binding protein